MENLDLEQQRKSVVHASIIKEYNRIILQSHFCAAAVVITGSWAAGGDIGLTLGVLANTADYAMRSFRGPPREFQMGREQFVDKYWGTFKEMPQLKWITHQIESGALRVTSMNDVPLLSKDLWPEEIKRGMVRSAIATGMRISVLGRAYDAWQFVSRLAKPSP